MKIKGKILVIIAAKLLFHQAEGKNCSAVAGMEELYNQSLKISSWDLREIPVFFLHEKSGGFDLVKMVDDIYQFSQNYPFLKDLTDCESALHQLFFKICWKPFPPFVKTWMDLPKNFRLPLDKYLHLLANSAFNWGPGLCANIDQDIENLLAPARHLSILSSSNFSKEIREIVGKIQIFLERFESSEKKSCIRVFYFILSRLTFPDWYLQSLQKSLEENTLKELEALKYSMDNIYDKWGLGLHLSIESSL